MECNYDKTYKINYYNYVSLDYLNIVKLINELRSFVRDLPNATNKDTGLVEQRGQRAIQSRLEL